MVRSVEEMQSTAQHLVDVVAVKDDALPSQGSDVRRQHLGVLVSAHAREAVPAEIWGGWGEARAGEERATSAARQQAGPLCAKVAKKRLWARDRPVRRGQSGERRKTGRYR